jgi:hypothetical protein
MPLVAAGAGVLVFRVVSGDEREANPRPSVAETSLIVAIISLFPPLLLRCFFAASSLFLAAVFWPNGKLLQRVDGDDEKIRFGTSNRKTGRAEFSNSAHRDSGPPPPIQPQRDFHLNFG